MLIEVHNVHARIVQATRDEADWLREYASIYTRGRGGRHKTVSLVGPDGELPAGFCGFIKAEHTRLGTDPNAPSWRASSRLRFADRRTPVGEIVDADLSWLYDFQREAVAAVLQAKRGVVKCPTGSGKTEVLSALVMTTSGMRWLMIAPRTQLAINAARRYLRRCIEADLRKRKRDYPDPCLAELAEQAGLEEHLRQLEAGEAINEVGSYRVGFVGDGTWDVRDTDTLVCATFQSLYANLSGRGGELLEWATGLLLDETHTAAAETYNAVVGRAVNAYWRVGFSATPVSRTDGKNALVLGATGRVIYEIKAQVLIDAGIFAKPQVVFLEHDASPDVPASVECKACKGKGITYEITLNMDIECPKCRAQGSTPPSYPVMVDAAIVKSKRRNARIIELAEIVETPAMIFVDRKIHGRALQKALEKSTGEKIDFIDQSSSTKVREQAVSDIERGEISYLVVSKVFREGVDAPNVRSVINASGGKSVIKILQQFGRGARVRKDKTAFAYYDFFDVGNDVLRRHSAARRNLIKREIGVEAKIRGPKQRELALGKRRSGVGS